MTAVDVGGQLVKQVSLVGNAHGPKVPEVVMGVADGKVGFQGGLLGQSEPVISSERHDNASIVVFFGGNRS